VKLAIDGLEPGKLWGRPLKYWFTKK
jgi:hypothetical protein